MYLLIPPLGPFEVYGLGDVRVLISFVVLPLIAFVGVYLALK